MKKELQEALFKKYPDLFVRRTLPMEQTCMCWGIQTGDGWYDIIDRTCQAILDADPTAELGQVKEKFGGLRMYVDGNEEANRIASDAEGVSLKVCELCGKPGRLRRGGWLQVRCDECEAKRNG